MNHPSSQAVYILMRKDMGDVIAVFVYLRITVVIFLSSKFLIGSHNGHAPGCMQLLWIRFPLVHTRWDIHGHYQDLGAE
jgi:hypothetical protein